MHFKSQETSSTQKQDDCQFHLLYCYVQVRMTWCVMQEKIQSLGSDIAHIMKRMPTPKDDGDTEPYITMADLHVST